MRVRGFTYRRWRYKNLSALKVQADSEAEASERQSIWILPLSHALLRFQVAESTLATSRFKASHFIRQRGLSAVSGGSNQDHSLLMRNSRAGNGVFGVKGNREIERFLSPYENYFE